MSDEQAARIQAMAEDLILLPRELYGNAPFVELCTLMSEISEEALCAGWDTDVSFALWRRISDVHADLTWYMYTLTPDDVAGLIILSNACKGWPLCDKETHRIRLIPMGEWRQIYGEWSKHQERRRRAE